MLNNIVKHLNHEIVLISSVLYDLIPKNDNNTIEIPVIILAISQNYLWCEGLRCLPLDLLESSKFKLSLNAKSCLLSWIGLI